MNNFGQNNLGQLIVQLLVIIIFLGAVYNLWRTTQTYGGLIGSGLRWLGLGIILFSLEAIDRVLADLSFINSISFINPTMTHNLILLLGLFFSAVGFSRLTKATKT